LQDKCEDIISKCGRISRTKLKRTRYAFITLESAECIFLFIFQIDAGKILRENKRGFCSKRTNLSYNNIPIYVAKAPEPDDIIWERLNKGVMRKKLIRIINYAIIGLIMIAHFSLCSWITQLNVFFLEFAKK